MKDFLAISVAAIVGANLRYWLSRLAAKEFGLIFPYGTLAINIVGSFIVGFFVIWTTERVLVDPRWRLLVVIGFCGSFTTFSSYAFETMSYFEQGQWGLMLTNVLQQQPAVPGRSAGGHGTGAGSCKNDHVAYPGNRATKTTSVQLRLTSRNCCR